MKYQRPEWGEDVQRLILATALSGDLPTQLLTEVKPELFGAPGSDRANTPSAMLARVMQTHFEKYRSMPSISVMTELVSREAKLLTPALQEALLKEWNYV